MAPVAHPSCKPSSLCKAVLSIPRFSSDRNIEKESINEFISKKREMFLLEVRKFTQTFNTSLIIPALHYSPTNRKTTGADNVALQLQNFTLPQNNIPNLV